MREHVAAPTPEIIGEAIDAAGKSSPGPDGIPLIAYKSLKRFAIPVLYEKFLESTRYDFEPLDFNAARLVLLAKSDSHLIEDTRPININNTDNRIIARAIVIAIESAFDDLIDEKQKMFIHGRNMTAHVRDVNDFFYSHNSALENDEQAHVLFLDTKKAFDSINHDFMHALLKHIGAPLYVVQKCCT